MNEINEAFNICMSEFKKLSLIEKREALLYSIKELIAIFEKLSEDANIKLEYIKNGEILDTKNNDSEEDFLEAEFVYIENAKNIIGQYLLKK